MADYPFGQEGYVVFSHPFMGFLLPVLTATAPHGLATVRQTKITVTNGKNHGKLLLNVTEFTAISRHHIHGHVVLKTSHTEKHFPLCK